MSYGPSPAECNFRFPSNSSYGPTVALRSKKNPQGDWDERVRIYSEGLASLGNGYALWEPDPQGDPQVQLGDVGYIRNGGFHRLFNVHLQPDDPSQPRTLPQGFEVLSSESSRIRPRTLRPGAYFSHSVRSTELASSISVP